MSGYDIFAWIVLLIRRQPDRRVRHPRLGHADLRLQRVCV